MILIACWKSRDVQRKMKFWIILKESDCVWISERKQVKRYNEKWIGLVEGSRPKNHEKGGEGSFYFEERCILGLCEVKKQNVDVTMLCVFSDGGDRRVYLFQTVK